MSKAPDFPTLFAAAQEGDTAARADLLAAYVPQIHAFIRLRMGRKLRRREESMDLVQTVCADFVKRAEGFELRSEQEFRGWLFQSALNKIREHGRFHDRQRRDPDRERGEADDHHAGADSQNLLEAYATLCTPSMAAAAEEECARIEAAIETLPEHYREVVVWARLVGLPHAETAERTGRTVSAVRNILGRALAQLGGLLETSGDG